ncbi:hypothetical protein BV25DRAFT_1922289 [Artomyces pyxidatus]|uniref:Uncharacterized protein n=1 Tax=Artomyces pyxidatus TaxID=48021 RepID=A0ACB8SFR3_9AGAM|nr:hypothetical protein BV25DRAFT_1922289 [Artomyces pyxidatus]
MDHDHKNNPPPDHTSLMQEEPDAWYAVYRGRNPGVYNDWGLASEQVTGFSRGSVKRFRTREDAERSFAEYIESVAAAAATAATSASARDAAATTARDARRAAIVAAIAEVDAGAAQAKTEASHPQPPPLHSQPPPLEDLGDDELIERMRNLRIKKSVPTSSGQICNRHGLPLLSNDDLEEILLSLRAAAGRPPSPPRHAEQDRPRQGTSRLYGDYDVPPHRQADGRGDAWQSFERRSSTDQGPLIPLTPIVPLGNPDTRYYVVLSGFQTGIFDAPWAAVQTLLRGHPDPIYCAFHTLEEASAWYLARRGARPPSDFKGKRRAE